MEDVVHVTLGNYFWNIFVHISEGSVLITFAALLGTDKVSPKFTDMISPLNTHIYTHTQYLKHTVITVMLDYFTII